MPGLTLTNAEMITLLGISKSVFYRLLKQGQFEALRAPLAERFSRAKVEAWVNGQRLSTRPWRAA